MHRSPFVLAGTVAGLTAVVTLDAYQPSSSPPAGPAGARPPWAAVVVGQSIPTRVGPVQVEATFADGRLVDVTPLHLTDASTVSARISAYAAPRLRAAALAKQSAEIDAVSGATVTSEAYKASLQSAFDQAAVQVRVAPTPSAQRVSAPPARDASRASGRRAERSREPTRNRSGWRVHRGMRADSRAAQGSRRTPRRAWFGVPRHAGRPGPGPGH